MTPGPPFDYAVLFFVFGIPLALLAAFWMLERIGFLPSTRRRRRGR